MNILKRCVDSFEKMFSIQYHFLISKNKKMIDIKLEFEKSDLKHLIGLQYLRDIAMSGNADKVFDAIKTGKITYEKISKSAFFYNIEESYADVASKIHQFPYLEEFLEMDNLILRYVKGRNPFSKINADFMIESTFNGVTMYIFLREKSNGNYCICSFFIKDKIEYRGETAYWLLKEKIDMNTNNVEIIYKRK